MITTAPNPNPSPSPNVVPLRLPVPIAETQGTLALALQPRLDPPSAPAGDLRVRRDVDGWAHRYVQAAVEIVGGDRPPSQLARWSSSEVYTDLERRARLVARAGSHHPGTARVQPVRPRVLSVRSCFPRPGCAEVSLHVRYGARSRAVAARFELRRARGQERWVCTALEFA